MDILEQYEKENPQIFRQSAQENELQEFDEAGALMRFVVRFSGGRIQNEKQATYILASVAGLLILVAIFLLVDTKSQSSQIDIEKITRIPQFLPPSSLIR